MDDPVKHVRLRELEEEIRDRAEEYVCLVRDLDRLDGPVTAWMMTGHILPAERADDGDDREQYFHVIPLNQPSHVCLGLAGVAKVHLENHLWDSHEVD